MQFFIVAEGVDYEGTSRQWVYTDPTEARNKYNQVVFKQRTGESRCDWVTIKGPFAEGEEA